LGWIPLSITITTSFHLILSHFFDSVSLIWWPDQEPQILRQVCNVPRFVPNGWFAMHFINLLILLLLLVSVMMNCLGVISFWVIHPSTLVCSHSFLLGPIRKPSYRFRVLSLSFDDVFDLAHRISLLALHCCLDCFPTLHRSYLCYDSLSI